VGALQHEVAEEASPMLQFLISHARNIVIAIVLFIIAIAGYWIYSGHADKQRGEERLALGRLMIISDNAMRLEKLAAYAPTAPDSVRREALFAMMAAANQTGDHAKAFEAWKQLGELNASLAGVAAIGMADALSAQEKYTEALAVLEKTVSSLDSAAAVPVNTRIVLLAEIAGDYGRAMTACDALLARPGSQVDVNMWTQKKAALGQKAAENKEQS
jgi:tetratricopeptide (TPR) repeat protein